MFKFKGWFVQVKDVSKQKTKKMGMFQMISGDKRIETHYPKTVKAREKLISNLYDKYIKHKIKTISI